ncbi:MAG: hypothetical protein L0Y58_16830 [Verrucomicrobia subdivision 3 bacterium]|nr:hypothetical protein [Limisphaerales bacterium]
MTKTLAQLSVAQLKRAVAIKEDIERLERQLSSLLGGPDTAPARNGVRRKGKRKMSAAGRARIAAAARARWAKIRAQKGK